jgi:hypothetical protein
MKDEQKHYDEDLYFENLRTHDDRIDNIEGKHFQKIFLLYHFKLNKCSKKLIFYLYKLLKH